MPKFHSAYTSGSCQHSALQQLPWQPRPAFLRRWGRRSSNVRPSLGDACANSGHFVARINRVRWRQLLRRPAARPARSSQRTLCCGSPRVREASSSRRSSAAPRLRWRVAARSCRRFVHDHRKPLARYRAMKSALRDKLALALLHHHWGHDQNHRLRILAINCNLTARAWKARRRSSKRTSCRF